ncbi:hypothetical protein NQ315_015285 [Exocentrus adspersus]|uniref:C2H2-type domain-containing protein n=1 Tax=Exocentrus adspersus TaxID=1586481 RepID=A0AAV8VAN9_9CUCU|nr:hypothetical protein NQ315_015285 [Exocentrus adspersus]
MQKFKMEIFEENRLEIKMEHENVDEIDDKDQITISKPLEFDTKYIPSTTENYKDKEYDSHLIRHTIKIQKHESLTEDEDTAVKTEQIETIECGSQSTNHQESSIKTEPLSEYWICDNCNNSTQSCSGNSFMKADPLLATVNSCAICEKLVNPVEIKRETYKCDLCTYKAESKTYLSEHMLNHKDPTKIIWHSCGLCEYKTKYKTHLNRHTRLIHKGPSWHKCDWCSFKSKRTDVFRTHLLLHKDSSKIKWFECDLCDYKSRWKKSLTNHVLNHKDPSQTNLLRCASCSFKSKYKSSLMRHMMRCHKVDRFRCDLCNFTSESRKGEHMCIQQSCIEAEKFKCDLKSKWKMRFVS